MNKLNYMQECALECLMDLRRSYKQAVKDYKADRDNKEFVKRMHERYDTLDKIFDCFIYDAKLITIDDYFEYLYSKYNK